MDKNTQNDHLGRQTIIGEDVVLDGDMHISGNLFLNGKVQGSVFCAGKVEIKRGAYVSNDVTCVELYLESEVHGSVKAVRVVLGKGAKVHGGIETSCLELKTREIGFARLRLTGNKR